MEPPSPTSDPPPREPGFELPPGLLQRFLDNGERRDSLVLVIAEWVAKEIITGSLLPGADLNSVDLAARFSTSRTPVREALNLLDREGLIELTARRRPRVATLDAGQIESAYHLLSNLFGMVAEEVASKSDGTDLSPLDVQMQRMQVAYRTNDVDSYFWANVDFHDTCGEIADNSMLKRTVDSLGLRVLRFRHRTLTVPGQLKPSVDDHARLLRAFRERDIELAGALSRSLVRHSLRTLQGTIGRE
ncbi:GntR family transcriptional regulator [Rhodococcoides kyotonense]|nr:GntR family transcriptional regulator [Rhodococcus kyotonensis]